MATIPDVCMPFCSISPHYRKAFIKAFTCGDKRSRGR